MSAPEVDLAAARQLVAEITKDLSALPADTPHARLRAEVEQLSAMLASAEADHPQVREGMSSVHTQLDRASTELQSDGVRAGLFLQGIARMLGLD